MKPFYYLSDFPERKNAGQNFVAECPKCGKKHLSISKKNRSLPLLLRRM